LQSEWSWQLQHESKARRLWLEEGDASKYWSVTDKPNIREFFSLAKAKQALRSESKCLGEKKKTCYTGADYDVDLDKAHWSFNFPTWHEVDPWIKLQLRLKSDWPRFIVKVTKDKVEKSGVTEIDGQVQSKGWREGFDSVLPSESGMEKMLQHVATYVKNNPSNNPLMGAETVLETAVPDGWEVYQSEGGAYCESDMQTAVMSDAHSYEKRTSSSFGIPETSGTWMGSGFSFGLSYEKKELLKTKGSSSRKMVAASSECGTYFAKIKDLANNPPPTEPAFQSLVNKAKTKQDYHLIFDLYGLHFPTELVFGARYGTTQYITSSSFMAYQHSEESLSLEFGVQVSVPTKVPGVDIQATEDASIGYSASEANKEMTSKYFNERRTFSVGKRLPAGGVDEWKRDVRAEPMPIKFSLVPMCKHPVFAADCQTCEAAWDSYCEEHLQNMHEDLQCGESEKGECIWDIDCEDQSYRCEFNMCVQKPECVVTLFDADGFGGSSQDFNHYWSEEKPVHIEEFNALDWKNRARSMIVSGGCAKVITMSSNALDAENNFVVTNYEGNGEKKQDKIRNVNQLALYPKEWWTGEKPDWRY